MGPDDDEGDLLSPDSRSLTPLDEDAELEAKMRNSASSLSTTSLMLEHMSETASKTKKGYYDDMREAEPLDEMEIEDQVAWKRQIRPADKRARRFFYIAIGLGLIGWAVALSLFLREGRHRVNIDRVHDPHATSTVGHGSKVTLDDVLTGMFSPTHHQIEWVLGPKGEDGMLLERGGNDGRDYLVVEDVRYRGDSVETQKKHSTTLMKSGGFFVGDFSVNTHDAWPNVNHTKVLVLSNYASKWRHSGDGNYWIFDVQSQTAEPLDPDEPHARIQKAIWSPAGDAVVFTRYNNMFIRHLGKDHVDQITTDGGHELFYGVPDWVYEEEVFASDVATWISGDGKYVAYLRTDESRVPDFPVQYFFSHPTGKQPAAGEENYPDVRNIKYPKAGAPTSVVSLQFYDVAAAETFEVKIDNDFDNDDRLITEVLWAGQTGKVLVRCTNRESDVLKMILIDAESREGRMVRERDVQKLDGGWFEVQQDTTFVPKDPDNGRPDDGYIDTVISDGYDHLAYFTPLDSNEPIMLTEGEWEVVLSPAATALDQNLVYFVATKDGSTQRHIYTVDLLKGPKSIDAVTDTSEIAYYGASFSKAGNFMLLSYQGPKVPWQKVQSTPSNKEEKTDITIEENKEIAELVKKKELPIEIYQTVNIDGFELNLVERRPPHFDESKKYPVLFYLYNGPGFQEVDRRFIINFQSYVASSLGYIVVTLDGRGTGFLGRKTRCIVRGNLGYWEAHDQIAAAKMWAAKKYVDADKMAIWGWSYGGFMTLKTLEMDAGQTFHYGAAVAPVTDWRFYDSIYTERYMHTPQHNPEGYANATISNATALGENVRFLVMHGYSDDNVHYQNTLALLDKLDQANVINYDTHVFPDSAHGISFHNAYPIVHKKLSDWLVNAFNGEWLRTADPTPDGLLG